MAGDLNFNFSAPTHRVKVHSSHRLALFNTRQGTGGRDAGRSLNLIFAMGRESGQRNFKVDQPESTT